MARLRLNPFYLLIALLPILVFFSIDRLLDTVGASREIVLPHFAPFDPHAEYVARLAVLAAFIPFVAVGLGALALFGVTISRLDPRSLGLSMAAFIGLPVLTAVMLVAAPTRETQDYLGPAVVCAGLGYGPGLHAKGKPPMVTVDDVRVLKGKKPNQRLVCDQPSFGTLRNLLIADEVVILFGVAALVIGAIACLADKDGDKGDKLTLYEAESSWLNSFLYMSAAFLVTGLLFIAALLKWPLYPLLASDRAAYEAQANGIVAYFGVSYTIVLASYYGPVAAILSGRVKPLKPGEAAEALPNAFKGPLQVLKIVLALGSSALAGAIPSLLNLGV